MTLKPTLRTLAEILLAWTLLLTASTATSPHAHAQTGATPATTHIADTVYNADGTPASGSVLVTWPAFTTSAGAQIQAGSTAVTLGAGGSLSVTLVPNAGSTPMGTYYTVFYHLASGAATREYWVVPATSSTVALAGIKSSVLPTSVAMQTVSKSYVDTAVASALAGHPLNSSASQPYVLKSGDTMSGALVLPGDPTAPTQAADKQYVDEQSAALTSGLAQKVSLVPSAAQTVIQPAGTQLAVNSLNGVQNAGQFTTGAGNNGIANAAASANCTSGCEIKADQTYAQSEFVNNANLPDQTHVDDHRGGAVAETFLNPEPLLAGGNNAARTINVTSTTSAPTLVAQESANVLNSIGLVVNNNALAGGNNTYPANVQGTVPYFKTTYSGMVLNGINNTVGQHILAGHNQNCFGVGDCLLGGLFLKASGGFRDDADEGAHPYDFNISEDDAVFAGTCAQGCTTGSTSVQVSATASPGTQGEGRYLLDTNPAKAITSGLIVSGNPFGRQASVTFTGTSFPVSVLLETAATIPSQANNMNPGTVTVPIVTSGPPTGFATNTAALPASSGLACIADPSAPDARALNFETAAYTVVDGSHLQLTLIRPHSSGATVAVGGLCGYGLEQKVDTVGNIRQVFPVIASTSSTSLLYAGGQSSIVGVQGATSAFANVNVVIASIARTGGIVTLTSVTAFPDLNGLTVTVAGVTDSSYNGSFVATTTGAYTLTYPSVGPDSTSTGGTLSLLTGAYGLYPMAETVSVYNPTTKQVDGLMTLAANNVPWAPGDTVEMPHYFQEKVFADIETVSQYTPRPGRNVAAGIEYDGNNGPSMTGWQITNGSPTSNYFGNGGTHTPPLIGISVAGVWHHAMELQAGEDAAIEVHCNSHGCDKWNSTYDLFQMDTSVGVDRMRYSPQTSTLAFNLRGTQYQMDPNGLTANTINVTTLNAGTVHGLFTGSVAPASLPVFGASGSAHQVGAVPDPGTSAGATRFLREDGTWSVPAGGVQSGAQAGTVTLTPGAVADYNYTVSGSTLLDASGNGNNATLGTGANAPAPQTVGMAFTAYTGINLPPVLNTANTILFSVYLNPLTASYFSGFSDASLIGNSVGWGSFNFYMMGEYSLGGLAWGAYGPGVYDAGGITTPVGAYSGYHVFGLVKGIPNNSGGCATLDHIYVDGLEPASYTAQGCSANEQASGNLILGSFTGTGIPGTAFRTVFYPGQLSAQQMAVDSNILRNQDIARGVVTAPQPLLLASGALNAIGDSITFGFPNLTPYSQLLTLENPPTTGVNNWGIIGVTLFALTGSEANRVGLQCKSATGPAVASVFAGTNDFVNITGATAQSVFGSLTSEVNILKAAGCRVGVGTMLSRTGSAASNGGVTLDTDKKQLNALILNGARAAGADFVIDFAAFPGLGADGAYANPTNACAGAACFQSDGIHPTQAGQQMLANVYSNAYNYTFGHNKANPNVVTAATYQMHSSDGALSLTAAAAQAVTMPDCTGPSGATYSINNSTAFTKTVIGGPAQPINGQPTAINIAPFSTLVLYDVANPETASGCHWEY